MSDRAPPIIVTAQVDADADALFNRRRQQFYPPALNRVPAHLTLFHQLPGAHEADIVAGVAAAAAVPPVFEVTVAGLMMLGHGVAYRITSETLIAFRSRLAAQFGGWLTGQDRQGFRPHVTVQNKVRVETARGTRAILERDFVPFPARIEAVQLWHYAGGPWQPLGVIALHTGPECPEFPVK